MTTDSTMRRPQAAFAAAFAVLFAAIVATAAAQTTASIPDAVAKAGDAVIAALRTRDVAALESRFDDNLRRRCRRTGSARRSTQLATQHRRAATMRRADGHGDAAADRRRVPLRVRPRRRSSCGSSWDAAGPPRRLLLPAAAAAAGDRRRRTREEAVTVGADGWPLPGTLLLPGGVAKPPVAVLVQGSGPNDRDETIGPNHVFADLANGLARARRRDAALRQAHPRLRDALRERHDRLHARRRGRRRRGRGAGAGRAARRRRTGLRRRTQRGRLARAAHRAAGAGGRRAGRGRRHARRATRRRSPTCSCGRWSSAAAATPPRATPEMVDEMRNDRDDVARLVATGHVEPGHEALPFDLPPSLWLDTARYDAPAALLGAAGPAGAARVRRTRLPGAAVRGGDLAVAARCSPGDVDRRRSRG